QSGSRFPLAPRGATASVRTESARARRVVLVTDTFGLSGLMLVPVAAVHIVAGHGAEKVRRERCFGLRQFLLARVLDRTHLDHETQRTPGERMIAVQHRDRVGEV